MSGGAWNGRVIPERADTVAGRVLALLERGLARFGVDESRLPAAANRLLVAPVSARPRPENQHERAQRLAARLLVEWQSLPADQRRLTRLTKRLGISYKTAQRTLQRAGFSRKMGALKPRAERLAEAVQEWREADAATKAKGLTWLHRKHRVTFGAVREALVSAGLLDARKRRRSA